MGEFQMMVWPAVTLIGFLFLTALVIAMGTQSTARYEQERRAQSTAGARHAGCRGHGGGQRLKAVLRLSAGWPGGGHSQFAGVSRTVRSNDSSRSNCASTL